MDIFTSYTFAVFCFQPQYLVSVSGLIKQTYQGFFSIRNTVRYGLFLILSFLKQQSTFVSSARRVTYCFRASASCYLRLPTLTQILPENYQDTLCSKQAKDRGESSQFTQTEEREAVRETQQLKRYKEI